MCGWCGGGCGGLVVVEGVGMGGRHTHTQIARAHAHTTQHKQHNTTHIYTYTQLTHTGIAEELSALWNDFMARGVRSRRSWGLGAGGKSNGQNSREGGPGGPEKLVDVELATLHQDPMAAVRVIYADLGLDLSAAAEAKMEAWLVDNARGKHGKNVYE